MTTDTTPPHAPAAEPGTTRETGAGREAIRPQVLQTLRERAEGAKANGFWGMFATTPELMLRLLDTVEAQAGEIERLRECALPEWGEGADYGAGALVVEGGAGTVYRANRDGNTPYPPGLCSGSFWERMGTIAPSDGQTVFMRMHTEMERLRSQMDAMCDPHICAAWTEECSSHALLQIRKQCQECVDKPNPQATIRGIEVYADEMLTDHRIESGKMAQKWVRLAALEAENDRLRARVAELEAGIRSSFDHHERCDQNEALQRLVGDSDNAEAVQRITLAERCEGVCTYITRATLEGEAEVWADGHTAMEALGELVSCFPDRFRVRVDEGDHEPEGEP